MSASLFTITASGEERRSACTEKIFAQWMKLKSDNTISSQCLFYCVDIDLYSKSN